MSTYRRPNQTDTSSSIHHGQRRRSLLPGLGACGANPTKRDACNTIVGTDKEECGHQTGGRIERRAAQDEAHHSREFQGCQMPCALVALA